MNVLDQKKDRFRPRQLEDLAPRAHAGATRDRGEQTIPTRRFDGAIFDFDGTIALSGPIWHEVDATFFARRGLPLEIDVPPILASLGFEEGADYVISRYHLAETRQEVVDEWNELAGALYKERVVLRAGVERYLSSLRDAGVALALATTNQPSVLAELAPRIDVSELFDAVVYSLEVGVSKNKPDVYLESARRLGTSPWRTVVFEDIPLGLAAARSAGFATVGVASGDEHQDVPAVLSTCDLFLRDWSQLA